MPSGFLCGLARRNLRADQNGPVDAAGHGHAGFLDQFLHARQFAGRGAGEQVPERTASECVLPPPKLVCKFDDRIAALAGQSHQCAGRSSPFSPSVMNVRRKNSVGFLYSSDPSFW